MPAPRLWGTPIVSALLTCLVFGGAGVAQQPLFRSGVEVVLIDVSVVDLSAKPVEGLGPDDFSVTVDRKPRKVVSALYISHHPRSAASSPKSAAIVAGPVIPGAPAPGTGRDILIVVDEDSMEPGDGLAARKAAGVFLDRLGPADRVGVATIPRLRSSLMLTTNRSDARKALGRVMTGTGSHAPARFWIGLSEAFDIERGDAQAAKTVVDRECRGDSPLSVDRNCAREVLMDAHQMALQAHLRSERSLDALRQLAEGLRQIEGPKTLVLVSGGMPPPGSSDYFSRVEAALNAAQVTLYTLYLERMQFGRAKARLSPTPMDDDRVESFGVENVTAAAGGALLRVIGGIEPYFERVATELSGSYFLAIEVMAGERDGMPHLVQVTVRRPGLEVRARKQYVIEPERPRDRRADLASVAGVAPGRGEPATASASPPRVREIGITPPEVEALLVRAGEYVAAYETQFSGVVSEELYEQRFLRWRSVTREWSLDVQRKLTSDYLLVKAPGVSGWVPFRDVFEVDGRKVRERDDRLKKLFLEAPATAFERAKEVVDESARYNIGFIERNINLPTLALMFLEPSNRTRFVFRKQGEQEVEGTPTWQIGYAERVSPTLVRDQDRDNPAEGFFWIDPRQGRIVKSTLRLKPGSATIEISVTYRTSEKLGGLWVPAEMKEIYTGPEVKLECLARYSNVRRFQVTTDEAVKILKAPGGR